MKIVLASSNMGKVRELQNLLAEFPLIIIPQTDLEIKDADETGQSFAENALIKARHAAEISQLPALADDSGLAIDYLSGRPGVYSARYSGTRKDEDNIAKVLEELAGVGWEHRRASYHCALVFLASPQSEPIICEGIWSGYILNAPQGQGGFGYDPIFWVPAYQKSAAELTAEEKNKISHRALAYRKLYQYLAEFLKVQN